MSQGYTTLINKTEKKNHENNFRKIIFVFGVKQNGDSRFFIFDILELPIPRFHFFSDFIFLG
jgi:hypothetical protein